MAIFHGKMLVHQRVPWPNCVAGERRSEIGSRGTSLAVHLVGAATGRRSVGCRATDLQDVQKSRNLALMQPVAQHLAGLMNILYMICCVALVACRSTTSYGVPKENGGKPLQKYEIEQIRLIFEIKWGQTPTFYCLGGIVFCEGA